MGVPPNETKASCHRVFVVPRAGKYKVWVRYVDHRNRTEPFRVTIRQGSKVPIDGELGIQPALSPNDEFMLFWGFSLAWSSLDVSLEKGDATLTLAVDRAGEGWRQLDAVLITDDLQYTPFAREKPPFSYTTTMQLEPPTGATWRGSARNLKVGSSWKRPQLAGRDFTMWTGIDGNSAWWNTQNVDTLTLYDVLFQFSPPADIKEKFHKQFAGRKDIPIMSWPNLVPGLYLATPDLSPDKPLRRWLERTKTPFYILTNYATPTYNPTNGPATFQALTGPLAAQFLGFIHGEAMGTGGITTPDLMAGQDRRTYIDAMAKHLRTKQAELWSKIFHTQVPETFWATSISCLSCESIALAHLFHEMDARTVGYEEDATNVHVPMRIAFERGAARQYGMAWLNYASGNFGDACNYFSQNPVVARGAPAWFHSKYTITDGVTADWYRKMYYVNFLGGSSAIHWEQGLGNQWILPGPGTHDIDLSPFGRGTVDFLEFVNRLPDRGEPFTPVAFLMSYGHGYERVNYTCKMLNNFPENKADIELRELFNVAWYPAGIVEGKPAAPDVQSMPSGVYGNIFDMLVDRPARAKAIFDYPVLWLAGDVVLDGNWPSILDDYVKQGGTLVVNVDCATANKLDSLVGAKFTGKTVQLESWNPSGDIQLATTPYDIAGVELKTAVPLVSASNGIPIITRNKIGEGAVILTLVPRMLGADERAHPALPYLMNGLTAELMPVEVRRTDGGRLKGEVMYQVNKTKDGYLVMLINNDGVDKTQNGLARVDRSKFADVVLRTGLNVVAAKEYTQPRDLAVIKKDANTEIALRVHPGDVQVVGLATR